MNCLPRWQRRLRFTAVGALVGAVYGIVLIVLGENAVLFALCIGFGITLGLAVDIVRGIAATVPRR